MDLYKIINQLTVQEFDELYKTFADSKADKSATFLKIIRQNSTSPEKEFLQHFDVSASAFYVLKSRLNQKVEEFLMNRLGDKNLDVISRVIKANEKVFENSRQMSIGALNKLEKELIRLDFPSGLMIVYKLLQNLHCFDADESQYYHAQYKKQVAFTLAIDNANDLLMQFFKLFDSYLLSRKEEEFQQILRLMEKIENLCNLYDSHRLLIYRSIIHLYGIIFLNITNEARCELESAENLFDKTFNTLNLYPEEPIYQHLHLMFNFLRYSYFEKHQLDKAQMYFEILDFKIEELITGFHLNAQLALFLFSKIRYHQRNHTQGKLQQDVEHYLSNINIDIYRPANYIFYQMFLAETYFVNKQYQRANKVLFGLRNTMSFRKYQHVDLEIKFLLAIGYVMTKEWELADQLMKTIQRQLRSEEDTKYEHCRTLNKILTVAAGNRSSTRRKNLEKLVPLWKQQNVGRYAMLKEIDIETVFLKELDE